MKKIFIDIDGVTGNLVKNYIIYYNELTKRKIDPEKFDVPFFDFAKFTLSEYPMSNLDYENSMVPIIFNTEGFWKTIPSMHEDVVKNVKELYDTYKDHVYFLTAPAFESKIFFQERIEWIKNNFPFFDIRKLIFCYDKSIFDSNSILIDDRYENLAYWLGWTIKVKYKHNEGVRTHRSIYYYEWNKIPQFVKEIQEMNLYPI